MDRKILWQGDGLYRFMLYSPTEKPQRGHKWWGIKCWSQNVSKYTPLIKLSIPDIDKFSWDIVIRDPVIAEKYGWLPVIYLPEIIQPPTSSELNGYIFVVRGEGKSTRMTWGDTYLKYEGDLLFEKRIRNSSRSGAHWDDYWILVFRAIQWLGTEYHNQNGDIKVQQLFPPQE